MIHFSVEILLNIYMNRNIFILEDVLYKFLFSYSKYQIYRKYFYNINTKIFM